MRQGCRATKLVRPKRMIVVAECFGRTRGRRYSKPKAANVFNRAKLCCVPIVNGEGNFHKLLRLFLAYRHSKNLDAVCPIEILKIGAATRIEVVIAGNARRTDEQAASKRELSPFSMSPKIERVGSITVMYPQYML